MWPETTRAKYERDGLRYASDMTDAVWAPIEPFLPPAKALGRPRMTDLREGINALLYLLRGGGPWRRLPRDFPPRSRVRCYGYAWRAEGTWPRINHDLLLRTREAEGRQAADPDRHGRPVGRRDRAQRRHSGSQRRAERARFNPHGLSAAPSAEVCRTSSTASRTVMK